MMWGEAAKTETQDPPGRSTQPQPSQAGSKLLAPREGMRRDPSALPSQTPPILSASEMTPPPVPPQDGAGCAVHAEEG